MNTREVLDLAALHLGELSGYTFDLIDVTKPVSPEAAVNLAKVVSKLSPILGNLIEFNTVEVLNDEEDFQAHGNWLRQDPGFPDTIFVGGISPTPGIEIKAWFPLATEITARFKDSQTHFLQGQTDVCMLAWLPENVIYGKPKIVGVCTIPGLSVAEARDKHYHRPPDYLVLEPEDTSARTLNLQQSNTNGYKWQGSEKEKIEAEKIVQSWGRDGKQYQPTAEYQSKLRGLIAKFNYRLDTNFAKMDRIQHREIEDFKSSVLSTSFRGLTIQEWAKLIASRDPEYLASELKTRLGITEVDTDQILE